MAEMTDSRKALIDMFQQMDKKQELIDKQERINKNIADLKNELGEIGERAYQAAIGVKVGEYQEKLAKATTEDERTQIETERKDFEANPEKYGVTRDKCPITDEADKTRALQIVNLLKDTDKLGEDFKEMSEADFVKYMEGFGERHAAKNG